MSKESYFSMERVRKVLIGAIVGFIIIFILFMGLQSTGILSFGGEGAIYYSVWAALIFSIVFFFAILLITPRKYLGPFSDMPEDEKVDSLVETEVGAMEENGKGHFHVKREGKEEDFLKHLEESHKPNEKKKTESDQQA